MKKVKKILLLLPVLALMFGQVLSVSAATVAAVPKITKVAATYTEGETEKKASSLTLYTNKGQNELTVNLVYTWTRGEHDTLSKPAYTATPANRGIANCGQVVAGEEKVIKTSKGISTIETKATLKVTAVDNGKTKIVLSDKNNTKSKKLTMNVTVKTWADEIVSDDNMEVGLKGTVTLAADAAASNGKTVSTKGVTYKVTKAYDADGKEVEAKNIKKIATVSAKGAVAGKGIGSAVVTVTSKDKQVAKEVTVSVVDIKVDKLLGIDENATNPKKRETTSIKLNMKGNVANKAHTYQIMLKNEDKDGNALDNSDLDFLTSKASVATVDENGLITAVGNGSATITVKPKLGNSKKVTYSVKVTTDVDKLHVPATELTIIADNKDSAAVNASTNVNASNKGVKYEVNSVMADGTSYDTKKDIAKYASVSSKGIVKAKQACSASIRVYASDKNYTDDVYVTVTANVPVAKIGFNDNKDKATYTVPLQYITDGKRIDLFDFSGNVSVVSKTEGVTPTDPTFSLTSSNTKVAVIEGTKVYGVGNGSAKITALANDGSKIKATLSVSVKTDAYEISYSNTEYSDVSGNVLYVEADKNTDVSKVLQADVNADASVKGVTYSPSKVKLADGETSEILITAKDTRTYGVKGAEKRPVTEKVLAVGVDKERVAKDYMVKLNLPADYTDAFYLKKGEKLDAVDTTVEAEDGGKVLSQDVTWSSNNKNVTVDKKTGVVTAKNTTGESAAVITATYQYGTGKTAIKATADYNVQVGRSDADVQKELNATLTNILKEENRDYLGAKAVFDSKNNHIDFDITEPEAAIAEMKDTGLAAAFEKLPTTIKEVAITDTLTNKGWLIVRDSMNLSVYSVDEKGNKTLVGEFATTETKEMITFLKDNILAGYPQLKDWNGSSYAVAVTIKEAIGTNALTYTFDYSAAASMKAARYDELLDNEVTEAVAALSGKFAENGLNQVSYNTALNKLTLDILDGSKTLDAVDVSIRTDLVTALKGVFENAASVTVYTSVNATARETVTRTPGNTTEEYMNAMLDKLKEQVKEHVGEDFAALDDVTATAIVTFKVGSLEYNMTYEALFVMGSAAADFSADAAIAAAIGEGSYDFGSAAYDKDKNALAVKVTEQFAGEAPMVVTAGKGLGTILEQFIASEKVTGATVIATDGTSSVIGLDTLTKESLALALLGDLTKAPAMYDLNGKTAVVKVTYNDKFTLIYKVTFEVEEPAAEEPDVPVSSNDLAIPEEEEPVAEPEEDPVDNEDVSGNNI